MFPMSLPDLAKAHRRDVDRQVERALVAEGARTVRTRRQAHTSSSLLAAVRRFVLRRSAGCVADEGFGPAVS